MIRVIPDESTLLTSLRNGEVDIYQQVLPDHTGSVEQADGLELVSFPGRDFLFLAWNARREALSDPEVRRALTTAIDRQGIVDALTAGYAAVVNSGVTRVHFAYDPSAAPGLGYDLEGAAALLADAGWEDRDGDGVVEDAEGRAFEIGIEVNSESSSRTNIAEIVQANLAAVGVSVTVERSDFATWVGTITGPEKDFDATIVLYNADFRVDERDMFHSESLGEGYAFSGTNNPTLDHLLDTLQTIVDPEAAVPVWAEYQAEIAREQPFTYLYSPDRISGVSNRIEGVRMDARGEWSRIQEWRVPPDRRKYASTISR